MYLLEPAFYLADFRKHPTMIRKLTSRMNFSLEVLFCAAPFVRYLRVVVLIRSHEICDNIIKKIAYTVFVVYNVDRIFVLKFQENSLLHFELKSDR